MKITDNLARSMDIALVAKPPLHDKFSGGLEWVRPLVHQIENDKTVFVRMPAGQFALRVMSRHRVEVLIFVEGNLAARTEVASGMQFVDRDSSSNFLMFSPPGNARLSLPASDHGGDNDPHEAQLSLLPESAGAVVQPPLMPPAGAGTVFVVARFVDEAGPGLKPPPQEFEVTFQMTAPKAYDLLVGAHLLTIIKPEALINGDDEVSFEPPQGSRPTFTCTCTGHSTGNR